MLPVCVAFPPLRTFMLLIVRVADFCAAVRSFDRDSGVCVIRVGRDLHRMVRASLTLLAGAKDARLSVTVEGVAGERGGGGRCFLVLAHCRGINR